MAFAVVWEVPRSRERTRDAVKGVAPSLTKGLRGAPSVDDGSCLAGVLARCRIARLWGAAKGGSSLASKAMFVKTGTHNRVRDGDAAA